MKPAEMIYRRKSVRSYTSEPLNAETLEKIQQIIGRMKSLYPDIPVKGEILNRSEVKCILPWLPAQVIGIYTNESEGALENAGFIFQQLELELQCMDLGVCWLGLGKPARCSVRADGLHCVMMMAFGHPKGEQLRDAAAFKRKSLAEISDIPDERLEPARLAPSSVNSQPWRFTHEGKTIHVHCAKQGIVKVLKDMNRIDVGICLAHLYVCNPESFSFFRQEGISSPRNCAYIGSLKI